MDSGDSAKSNMIITFVQRMNKIVFAILSNDAK